MTTKRQQTMAKITRERAVKEKREKKLEKKRVAKAERKRSRSVGLPRRWSRQTRPSSRRSRS